jgi:hypothetical protein
MGCFSSNPHIPVSPRYFIQKFYYVSFYIWEISFVTYIFKVSFHSQRYHRDLHGNFSIKFILDIHDGNDVGYRNCRPRTLNLILENNLVSFEYFSFWQWTELNVCKFEIDCWFLLLFLSEFYFILRYHRDLHGNFSIKFILDIHDGNDVGYRNCRLANT